MKHVTVVISYCDRRQLLQFTLYTISRSAYTDFDVIIVNDVSSPDQSIDDLPGQYRFPIKVINLNPPKVWHNPCYAFNTGFKEATGDIILMNQCECCHRGDIISRTAELVRDDNYVSFQTYSLDKEKTEKIRVPLGMPLNAWIDLCVGPLKDGEPEWEVNRHGWWNHPVHRPMGFHWAAAMTRSNLEKLKGFDERFAFGWWYDDTEFLTRILRLGLSIEITSDKDILCLHQFHDEVNMDHNLVELNRSIYKNCTCNEISYASPENFVYNPCP